MSLGAVIELGGLLLSNWAKRISTGRGNTDCPFSQHKNDCENSTLLPEIALGGLLAARMDLINNQLTQRGFLLGSCIVCDNDTEAGAFHLSVGLSPTLITKLACSCNLPLLPHNAYDAKQRLFLAQEALKIIDRCGIKYKSHCLLHRRDCLHKVVSNRSITDINNYFGGSIAIFFTWLKFLTVSLTLPSYIGLFIFAYQCYSGIADDWYTPLFCCGVVMWNIVFVKLWRQHVSISKFSWGHEDQLLAVNDKPVQLQHACKGGAAEARARESGFASALRLVRLWMGFSFLAVYLLFTIPLTIVMYLEVVKITDKYSDSFESEILGTVVECKNYIGLLLFCGCSFVVEKLGRQVLCPLLVQEISPEMPGASRERKMRGVHVDMAYMLIVRFSILLYLCFWEHHVAQARILLSLRLILDQFEIMHAARSQKMKLRTFRIPQSTVMLKPAMKNLKHESSSTVEGEKKRLSASGMLFRTLSHDDHEHIAGSSPSPSPSPAAPAAVSMAARNSPRDDVSCESVTDDSAFTSKSNKKKKKMNLKNFTITKVAHKVARLVTGHSAAPPAAPSPTFDSPEQPSTQPSSQSSFPKGFMALKFGSRDRSASVGDGVEGEEGDWKNLLCRDEWKPRKTLDVTPEDGNLLMEDVYAPICHIEMGHSNKIYLFGVVTIFSGIYPLAPLIVIAQVAAMYEDDLASICSSQRPLLVFMRNIDKLFEFLEEWLLLLETLCFLSIVVNCYLAFVVSPHGHLYIPDAVFGEGATGAIWFTVAFEHCALLAYILFNLLVTDVPAWVAKGVEDAKAKENKKRIGERRLLYELQNPENTRKEDLEKILILKQTLDMGDEEGVTTDIQSIAATKIATLYNSCGWALNPFTFVGLTIVPTILQYFYAPLYHYSIPFLFFFAYYVHALHERRVKAAVMGMISDPNIVRLLVKDLPDWVKESDRHQCEWMNVLAQQCMYMCHTFEIRLQKKLNETLDRVKPAFVTGMVMEMMTFGTIPPNILSVKVLPAIPGTHTITADVEFSYAGNFRMLIAVGLLGGSTKLDFYDLRLSGEARVQLEPSTLSAEEGATQQGFKPFRQANISFMKRPQVDISFSLGETDGRKLKSEARGFEANLGQTVKHMIATKALYPKSIQINLDKSASTGESYSIANPIGVLQVRILGGTQLEIGDIKTSDPYVEVRYADEIEKTAVMFQTLNPVWNNEVFEFLVFNDDMTRVELNVYDYNLASSPDFLGNVSFDFNPETSGEEQPLDLCLLGVTTGRLQVAVTYFRLKEAEVRKKAVDDLLGSLPQHIIVGDIIDPDFALPLVDTATDYREMKQFQSTVASKKKRKSLFDGIFRNVSSSAEGFVIGQSSILGVLMISRIACRDLVSPSGGNKSLALSSFSPYVQFEINGLTRATKTSRGSLNPSFFDEYKAFILRDYNSTSFNNLHLIIKLKSRKTLQKDVTIATVTLLVRHILANPGQELYVDQPFLNADGREHGRLQANLKIISSKL